MLISPIIHTDGAQEWRNEAGQLHRLDGPAFIAANGAQAWWVDGLCHRLDGPAFIDANGAQSWWVDGKCHRLDGPAVIRADGSQYWLINGVHITNKLHEWMSQMSIDPDYTKWTASEKMWFKLRFC